MLLPLPRALLALACAAPLLVARASSPPNPVGANGTCASITKGSQASSNWTLLAHLYTSIPANIQWAMVIKDNFCYQKGLALLGYRVTVCDADQPPVLDVATKLNGITAIVDREGQLLTEADLYLYEYCGRKCCKTK